MEYSRFSVDLPGSRGGLCQFISQKVGTFLDERRHLKAQMSKSLKYRKYGDCKERTRLILPVVNVGLTAERTSFHSSFWMTEIILRKYLAFISKPCNVNIHRLQVSLGTCQPLTRRLMTWSKSMTKTERMNSASATKRLGFLPSKNPKIFPYFLTKSAS